MAQKIVLIDDIDGSEATQTVRFSLNGREYEIDLSDMHVEQLSKALEPYVANGRELQPTSEPVSPMRGRGRPRRPERGSERPDRREDFAAVRAWAREQKIEVSDRGRIKQDVLDAYDRAHRRGDEPLQLLAAQGAES